MRRFYFDPLFVALLICPLPFWLLIKSDTANWSGDQLVALLTLGLLYPLVEEIIFRGYIQNWFHTKFNTVVFQISMANILTSVLFSASHLINHPTLWALSTLLPSLVFGYVMDRYKTLAAPITLHATYNIGYFLSVGLN